MFLRQRALQPRPKCSGHPFLSYIKSFSVHFPLTINIVSLVPTPLNVESNAEDRHWIQWYHWINAVTKCYRIWVCFDLSEVTSVDQSKHRYGKLTFGHPHAMCPRVWCMYTKQLVFRKIKSQSKRKIILSKFTIKWCIFVGNLLTARLVSCRFDR